MRHFLFAALASSVLATACAAGDGISQPTSNSSGDGGDTGAGGRRNDGGGGNGDGGRPQHSSGSGAGSSSSGSTGSTSTSTSDGGGTTTSGTTTTTTDSGSSSSTGSPCDEDPCKLVSPQCGCGVDEKCSLNSSGDRLCVDDGTRTQGQECGDVSGDCEAGALCVYVFGTDNEISSCGRFCTDDGECEGQGGLCVLGLSGVEDVQLCSDNCDLVSGSGCAIDQTTCDFGFDADDERYFTICTGDIGVGTQYDACDPVIGCAPGNSCFETQTEGEFVCFQWCSTAAPNCPGDLECFTDFDPPLAIGNIHYGVCQG